MQTNPTPEQWARDLFWAALKAGDNNNYEAAYAVIQAAFAEREARLVGALKHIKHESRKNKPDPDRIYGLTLAALKDRTHG